MSATKQIRCSLDSDKWDEKNLVELARRCFKDAFGDLELYDPDRPITTWGMVREGVAHLQEKLFYRDVSLAWMAVKRGTIIAVIENLVDKNDYLPLLVSVRFENKEIVFEVKY